MCTSAGRPTMLTCSKSQLCSILSIVTSPRFLCTQRLPCPYTVLDVPKSADKGAIKAAFAKLSMKFHPDVNSSPHAAADFQAVAEAYQILGNEREKRHYDHSEAKRRRYQPVPRDPSQSPMKDDKVDVHMRWRNNLYKAHQEEPFMGTDWEKGPQAEKFGRTKDDYTFDGWLSRRRSIHDPPRTSLHTAALLMVLTLIFVPFFVKTCSKIHTDVFQ